MWPDFFPSHPSEAHLGGLDDRDVAELESHWFEHGGPWRDETIPATAWNRARVRPANHPVPRLLAAAASWPRPAHRGGTLPTILGVVLEPADPIETLRALTGSDGRPGIGSDRAIDMLASGIIPLALALAAHSGDLDLADAASRHWERLPAPSPNAVTRRAMRQVAGASPLGKIGARGAQGLIHLDTVLCQPRRCFECPIAAAELSVNAVKGEIPAIVTPQSQFEPTADRPPRGPIQLAYRYVHDSFALNISKLSQFCIGLPLVLLIDIATNLAIRFSSCNLRVSHRCCEGGSLTRGRQ